MSEYDVHGTARQIANDSDSIDESRARRRRRADWRRRLPFFYGWLIVVASLLVLGMTYSVMYSFSVFYVALLEEFGWGRAETAGIYSIFMIVTGVGALGAGMLADRFGPGRVIACGGVWLAIGLYCCSRVSALWQFYLSFGGLVAFGVSLAGWTPCVTMVNRWFSARLGLALGIASAGIGVGIMAIVPSVQFMIGSVGWRTAFVVLSAFVLCGLVPLGLFVLRGRPEDMSQTRDGVGFAKPGHAASPPRRARSKLEIVDAAWASREWTLAAAARTWRLWTLSLLKLMGGIATQMIFVHQVVYLVDSGYERMLAASVVGLIGLLSVVAKIFWGWSADTIGRELTYTLGCTAMMMAVGLLVLIHFVPHAGVLYLYAVMFAFGYGVSAPLWPLVTSDLFAGRNFGAIYGLVNVFTGLGSALGAWLGGHVFDLTGSYAIAFGAAVAANAVSAAALWIVAPSRVRRVQKIAAA